MDKKKEVKLVDSGEVMTSVDSGSIIGSVESNEKEVNDRKSLVVALSQKPKQTEKHPIVKTVDYIPISVVEATLDEYFGPLRWDIPEFNIVPLGGEFFMAFVKVRVLDPTAKRWLTYSGTISKKFSANQINGFAGAMKSLAVKNALAPLGDVFGRNLNRKVMEKEYQNDVSEEIMDEMGVLNQIDQAENLDDLQRIQEGLPRMMKRNPVVSQKLNQKFKEVNHGV